MQDRIDITPRDGNIERLKVLVTGGSQGIGLGIAEVFARAGATIAIASRTAATLEERAPG
ncbi:SDR family NAD(P)-dependent oxidoreductase [Rhodococcus sp. WS4]|jgi:NAD(P)-dependent dehydrogenase (short-subunit alcohol dehydrogenase family)|nr:SDR family NAD(P)-dependent oxidoreductase [Rhodococcus sp. WS4]